MICQFIEMLSQLSYFNKITLTFTGAFQDFIVAFMRHLNDTE